MINYIKNNTSLVFFNYFLLSLLNFSFLFADTHCLTVKQIQDKGVLRVGIYEDDPYFSYMNDQTRQLEGFDVDIAKAIAKEILGDPNKIEFITITTLNRVKLLQEGKIDLMIAEQSIKREHPHLVDLSNIYYVAGQSFLVKISSKIRKIEDLNGKRIGVIANMTNALRLEELLPKSKFVHFETIGSGFKALDDDMIQGFSLDDTSLLGYQSQRFHKHYRFVGGELAVESYGIATTKGCGDLLEAVNTALKKIKADGTWQKIYDATIGHLSQVRAHPPK